MHHFKGQYIPHNLFKSGILSEKIGFDSDGSTVIVDNSNNAHIFSQEYMLVDKIDPIIYNVVETICGKYLIPEGISQLSGPGLIMRGNSHK